MQGSYCYRLSTNGLNWNTAKHTCKNEGTRLVIIETQAEFDVVKTFSSIRWVFKDLIKPN
jgi:hypothetical protein